MGTQQETEMMMIGPYPINMVEGGGIASVISNYSKSEIFRNLNIKYLSTSCIGNQWQRMIALAVSLLKFIPSLLFQNIKLIHIHTASWGSFYRKMLYVWLGLAFRKKIILHMHGGEFNLFYNWGPQLNRWLITKLLDNVDLIVVLTNSWLTEIQKKTKNKNLRILFNPVNTNELSPDDHKDTNEELNHVIFIGKICANKGIYDLLQAVPLVLRKRQSVRFILCGAGEIKKCRKICVELGIMEFVFMCGWVSGQEKLDLIHNADIFVLPSYNEGLPITILEAMSAGLPIISTFVGGIPDIIEEKINGFLIQPADRDALAERMIELLSDRSLRQWMGEQNKTKAKTLFDVNVVMRRLSQIYQEMLTTHYQNKD